MEMFISAVVSGLLMGMLFALVALGLAIIFGVMNIVNFAHGEFLMIGMYAAFLTATGLSIDPLLTLPVSAALCFVLGLFSYYALVKYLLKGPMLAQLLGTFGLMIFLRYLAMAIFGPDYKTVEHGVLIGKSINWGSIVISYSKLGTAVISVLAFIAIFWIMNKTRLGMALKATALDVEAASYMGIDTEKMRGIAWGLGGASDEFLLCLPDHRHALCYDCLCSRGAGWFRLHQRGFYRRTAYGADHRSGGDLCGSTA
jgi:branched-chain amino acid transport system permease protein